MNIDRCISEIQQMPATIRADMIAWKRNVENGGIQMEKCSKVLTKIIYNKNLLTNVKNNRDLGIIERRFNRLLKKLDTCHDAMQKYINMLNVIKERAECMWRRLQLWNDDSCIRNYCISWKLTTPKLLKFLEFMYKRYDYEWEVKEMAVLELENITTNHDLGMLIQSWRSNQHAGGYEFNNRLRKFFKAVGVRYFITHGRQRITEY